MNNLRLTPPPTATTAPMKLAQPTAAPATATLAANIAVQLRQMITQGEFSPGQRLSEQVLSDSLGISRNTLREVFRVLTKEALIRHEPNRGVFVAVPTMASIIDIYRVRRLIECQALSQAYARHPAEKKMREAVRTALRHRDSQSWPDVGTANMAFHMAVVELADSERLNGMFAPVLAELRLAFGLLRDPEALHAPYVGMNLKILELAEAGEFTRAAAALNDYLLHSERIVLAVYARHAAENG